MVKGEIHERGDGHRPAFTDHFGDRQSAIADGYSFLIGTNVSLSPRQTRSCARCPFSMRPSSRPASAALETDLPFTERITSPARTNPAAGPSGSTSVITAPVCPDG